MNKNVLMLMNVWVVGLAVAPILACRSWSAQPTSDVASNSAAAAASQGVTILELSGASAQKVYAAFDVSAQGSKKSWSGRASVQCQHRLGGGQIPPGAQGIVAPESFDCSVASVPEAPHFPPGAQGMPAPVVKLLTITGGVASDFYAALQVSEENRNGAKAKSFVGSIDFECSQSACKMRRVGDDESKNIVQLSGVSAQKVYNAFDAQASNNAKSWNGKASVSCTHRLGGGSIPAGAQGMVAPESFDCSVTTVPSGGLPPGVQGMPAQQRKLLTISGGPASDFYDAFSAEEQTSGNTRVKSFVGVIAFECKLGSTPAAQPESNATCKITKQSSPDDDVPQVLLDLSGSAAQKAYDACNVQAQSSKKSWSGKAVINCSHRLGGGQIPPGAQGMVAPESFACTIMSMPSGGLPPGVQGMPAQPFKVLSISGAGSANFYNAVKLPEQITGNTKTKSFTGNLVLDCKRGSNADCKITRQ